MNKLEQGLHEGPFRSQALVLLLWVSLCRFCAPHPAAACKTKRSVPFFFLQMSKALLLRYHPLTKHLTDKVN